MNISKIIVVAGMAGVGKTTWIQQQLSVMNRVLSDSVLYLSPGVGNVPIDQTRLATEFPFLKMFKNGEAAEFFKLVRSAEVAFVEQGAYLEHQSIEQILPNLNYRKVAIVPVGIKDSEYHIWADEIVTGTDVDPNLTSKQLCRIPTIGEVIDENSLNELWYELTEGAYGKVTRAKGIFDVTDGRSLYADFGAGIPPTPMLELDLPRHLDGRSTRFSGLEILGEFNEIAFKQTLEDCYLSDEILAHYQKQVQQYLREEVAV